MEVSELTVVFQMTVIHCTASYSNTMSGSDFM